MRLQGTAELRPGRKDEGLLRLLELIRDAAMDQWRRTRHANHQFQCSQFHGRGVTVLKPFELMQAGRCESTLFGGRQRLFGGHNCTDAVHDEYRGWIREGALTARLQEIDVGHSGCYRSEEHTFELQSPCNL